jgi:soluble lytic murein transglycosylase-like protein
MPITRRVVALGLIALPLAACSDDLATRAAVDTPRPVAAGSPELRAMIDDAAERHGVPRDLVHRVVIRESRYNPAARNGPYWGLMQIHPTTARTMGYQGPPEGLLDAETNLEYAVKYLRGAWLVARGDHDAAVRWYARGYYYEAKRLGLLRETGLRA